MNDFQISNLENHKARKIAVELIATFLPDEVVDGLNKAVELAGLHVANMTLEPIAAIQVAIPERFRLLNIALVDVGAGTSDISITKDGSIIAYGMIPIAGDSLTETIAMNCLTDFYVADQMKQDSTKGDIVTYEDIMGIPHKISSAELWEVVEPTVEKITKEIADKIRQLNGDKSVSACFIVGGGGKIEGFTDSLAKHLDIVSERVALRGEEVLKEVIFEQEDIKKDPLLVTPIGICMNYYEQRNNFIMVRFNGELLKLYDNNRLTVVDAALTAGFPNEQIFPKRGKAINFTVNGAARIARGEAGESAIVTINGRPASINAPLEPNCEIYIEPSTSGADAVYTVADLDEYNNDTVGFVVNGKMVTCPKFVQVNGSLEPGSYEIQEGDVIETRNFYTVGQVAEFMDVEVDMDRDILVNNREADFGTLVYENFSIEWTVLSFGVADEPYEKPVLNIPAEETASEETVADETAMEENEFEDVDAESVETEESEVSEVEGTEDVNAPATPVVEMPADGITVYVNGEPVPMVGKKDYIFVDIFDRITFDLNAGGGRAIATRVNGLDAAFTQPLHDGDKVELFWKEN